MKSQESYGKYDAYLKFHGAIDNDVTGSMHRYTTFIDQIPFRVGLDAGVHQGRGVNQEDKKVSGVTSIPDIILMSHSHLDHCGNLPLLSKEGFIGKVLGTEETLKGINTTLIDSLVVMQRNAENEFGKNKSDLKKKLREYWKFTKQFGPAIQSKKYLYEPTISENMHHVLSKGHHRNHNIKEDDFDDFIDYHLVYLKYIYELKGYKISCPADIDNLEIENNYLPYDSTDIANIVSHFSPIPQNKEIVLKKGRDNCVSTIFVNAGHIVGSSQIMIKDQIHGNIWFTGDRGRLKETLYLPAPILPGNTYGKIDTLITESTYGDKLHPPRGPEQKELMELIVNTKGNVLVAAFSNNRHQDFQQFFADIRDSKEYGKFADTIVLDGFTSKKFTELFQKHSSHTYNNLDHRALKRAEGKGTEKVDRYLKNGEKNIVIVSSGMMNGGAIETYMHSVLSDPEGLLVITGYQAAGSRGQQILSTGKYKLNGITHDVKSNVYQCKTFSSHADRDELITLIGSVKAKLTHIVHGEMSSKKHLEGIILKEGLTQQVCIPEVKGDKHPIAYR